MPAWMRAFCVPLAAFGLMAAGNPCEPSPEGQKALEQLEEKSRDLPYAERLAYQRKAYEDPIRQNPGEIAIERRYLDLFKNDLTDELPALQKRYRERAARNPKDAAAYLAGVSLQRYDTPQAIRLMESAKTLDPGLGWTYLSLSNTYSHVYERIRDRSDLLVLTMNIDEELGLVEPFLKEKGFTFPVLPAFSFVNNLLEGVAIPQTWILDRHGKWQWEMIGFNSQEADWEGSVLAKLEAVHKGM